ncbi:MAG: GIY-YIG nuclease family protein [Candidatus Kerfeldbacteria bacterium]|nr:GIY-YIG nuclease family protein [Candidatus Kerfeldbacteria bacterium]
MFTVYVLKSKRNGKRYVGYTSKKPTLRLGEHNQGSNTWSRHNGPFSLIHTEKFPDKTSAIKRERFLKSDVGRKWLDSFLSDV